MIFCSCTTTSWDILRLELSAKYDHRSYEKIVKVKMMNNVPARLLIRETGGSEDVMIGGRAVCFCLFLSLSTCAGVSFVI